MITEGNFLEDLRSSFFLKNNIIIFFTTIDHLNNKFFFDAKIFNKHININKFIDEVTTSFDENLLYYEDIKILGEKIINKKTEKEIFLTALEKNILILLIDRKQIEKKFLLESVLKLKKDL